MKKQTKETYEEWISDFKSKLQSKPEKLKQFEALIAGDEDVEKFLSSSVVAERELYRQLNTVHEKEKTLAQLEAEARAKHAELTKDAITLKEWAETVSPQVDAAIGEARAARAAEAAARKQLAELGFAVEDPVGNTKPGGEPAAATVDNPLWGEVQRLTQRVQVMDASMPVIAEQLASVLLRNQKEGFELDPKELISTASQRGVSLPEAYEAVTAPQRAERLKADFEKQLKAAREDGERQALTRLSSPDRLGATRPSAPDMFRGAEGAAQLKDKEQRLDAAVSAFLQLGPESFGGF